MLQIRDVSQVFDNQPVLSDVVISVETGEIMCLLGPSGGGKTTLLRIIAGLETTYAGDVLLDGKRLNGVPVHQRGVGLMFQDFALFPHMTVAENVLFGLKMQNVPATERQSRLKEILKLVGLSGFDARNVNSLSGGERQRVALARSLAPRPKLLMLDEPLGSLDAALKERLLPELRDIIKSLNLTAVYVTHDRREAYAIADRIAVMHDGRMAQVDTPTGIVRHPRTRFVAQFLGLSNIVPIETYDNGMVTTPIGQFVIPEVDFVPAALLLHSNGLTLNPDAGMVTAIVTYRLFSGESYTITVEHSSGQTLNFNVPSFGNTIPEVGDTVHLKVADWALIPLAE